jgi:hypothetical protein
VSTFNADARNLFNAIEIQYCEPIKRRAWYSARVAQPVQTTTPDYSRPILLQCALSNSNIAVGLLAWAMGVAAVVANVWRYEPTAVPAVASPSVWPTTDDIIRGSGKPVIVMFLHPHCPCSKSSIEELGKSLAKRSSSDVHVAMIRPNSTSEKWERGELWDAAAMLPGVRLHVDFGGALARAFKATTSGHVVLYDEVGRLKFSGGLTPSRGATGGVAKSCSGRSRRMVATARLWMSPVFLQKPFGPADLARKVREVLDEKQWRQR